MTLLSLNTRPKKQFPGRGYPLGPGGEYYPSVTTILDVLPKPGLVYWAADLERQLMTETSADIVEEILAGPSNWSREAFLNAMSQKLGKRRAFEQTKGGAASIGTAVHTKIEKGLRKELDLPEKKHEKVYLNEEEKTAARSAYSGYETWRSRTKFKPTHIEVVLHSPENEFAGTADVIGRGNFINEFMSSDFVVGDWKTSKAIYISACLQISAYRHCMVELNMHPPIAEPVRPIPLGGLVLRLAKDPDDDVPFEARFIPEEKMLRYFEAFLHVKKTWEEIVAYEKENPYKRKAKKKTEEA